MLALSFVDAGVEGDHVFQLILSRHQLDPLLFLYFALVCQLLLPLDFLGVQGLYLTHQVFTAEFGFGDFSVFLLFDFLDFLFILQELLKVHLYRGQVFILGEAQS